MKKLLSAAALVALIATPAAAKTYPNRPMHQASVSLGSPQTVDNLAFRGAQLMGQDPDPRVRFELERDNPTY